MNENYTRVIPRDLFNEAKLLKCIGRLCLLIHDQMTPVKMSFTEPDDPFRIALMDEGSLTLLNVVIKIKGKVFLFKTTYNSNRNYPLYVESKERIEYLVFDESGEFDFEFLQFIENYA